MDIMSSVPHIWKALQNEFWAEAHTAYGHFLIIATVSIQEKVSCSNKFEVYLGLEMDMCWDGVLF